jgi:hypothetical protein
VFDPSSGNLGFVVDKVANDEMGGACTLAVEKRNAYRILVGKPEVERPLGRPRHWWVGNIKWILER